MMRWVALLLLLAAPAAAQERPAATAEVVARAGEHGPFTRLTLTFDTLPNWRIGRAGDGYEVRLDAGGYTFDLSTTFTRITRDRIAEVTPTPSGSGLQVDLGCPCHLRAFVAEGRILVLDVYPGAAPAGSPFETVLEGAEPPSAAMANRSGLSPMSGTDPFSGALAAIGQVPTVPRRGAVLLPPDLQAVARVDGQELQKPPVVEGQLAASSILNPTPPGLPSLERFSDRLGPGAPILPEPAAKAAAPALPEPAKPPSSMPSPTQATSATITASAPAPRQPEDASAFSEAPPGVGLPDPRINILRDQLVRGLGAAAARGVVEFDGPDGIDEVRARAEQALRRPEPEAAPEPEAPAKTDHAQLALRTQGTDATRDRALDGHICIADDALDIGEWGSPETLTEDIARHRARLVAEFDKVRPAAVEALAKTYLSSGFGAEARLVLRSFLPVIDSAALPDAAMLTSISHIVDGEIPPRPHPFEGQEVCDGHVALWAVLANNDIPTGPEVDQRALERGFAALPPHLRSHLGPELVARLLKAGHDVTARNLRLSLVRAASDPDASAEQKTSLDLVDARIDIHDGQHLAAERGLGAIIEAKSPLAIQAVVEMVDSRVGRGAGLDAQELLALGALSRENRGGPNAARLRRAEALAVTMAGDPARAMDEILPPGDPVHSEVWALLADQGTDGALISVAVPRAARARTIVAPTVREDLADRLLGLGFADAAASWLTDLTGDRALVLRARAELDRDAPKAALVLLTGLQGPEASALRGRALMRLGQPRAAAEVFASAGLAQDSQRAALQAGDVARIVAGPDERLSQLAQQVGRLPNRAQEMENSASKGEAANEAQPILPQSTASQEQAITLAANDDTAENNDTTAVSSSVASDIAPAIAAASAPGADTLETVPVPDTTDLQETTATEVAIGQTPDALGSGPIQAKVQSAEPPTTVADASASPSSLPASFTANAPLAAGRALIGAAQRDRDIIRALITPAAP